MSVLMRGGSGRMEARAREAFGVEPAVPWEMERLLGRCAAIYRGEPEWLDPEEGVGTVDMARAVCAETARLTMLGVRITVDGGERADWLQREIDRLYFRLRAWVELGCAYGTVIFKPNGEGVELVTPERFLITQERDGEVSGCVFQSQRQDGPGRWFTRLEYHRFLPDGRYAVSNRCFAGGAPGDMGKAVAIRDTPWADLAADMAAEGVERPLFAVLRTPGANHLVPGSAMGLPVFAGALRELRDLDVAYSRNAGEIYESQRLTLLDDRLVEQTGYPLGRRPGAVKLPRFVRKVFGAGPEEYYQDVEPALRTETRLTGINALLSQIGFKCGFSNGYFAFNERSGLMTAAQVEADDRRTIQLVKDMRDRLEAALDGLLYALDRFAEGYRLAPAGRYEAVYDFGDITYNREEDRARWWGYVTAGKAPFWYFLTKFEGFSEEQAKRLAEGK